MKKPSYRHRTQMLLDSGSREDLIYLMDLFVKDEEKEVKKYIEWAIKEIEGLETETSQNWPHNKMIEKEIVLDILNQLDEPEANSQIDKLANFIMSEVEGEPSQSQGAVDTAIRVIKSYQNQDRAPVVLGKWVAFDPLNTERPYNWVCSSCGDGCVDYRTAYCPDCGAKMEEA